MQVKHDAAQKRFVVSLDGEDAFIQYSESDGILELLHTEVPEAHEGKGVGSRLAKGALDHARSNGLRVIPTCRFVHGWISKHPEYEDIVAPDA